MTLQFPFRNISVNNLLPFVDERENIYDFILTEEKRYPQPTNFFLKKIERYKNSLPNFENELLQTINTTNQETIDFYFVELKYYIENLGPMFTLDYIVNKVEKWNNETLFDFEQNVKKETEKYFKDENRERKHLEEYESYDFGLFGFFGHGGKAEKVKRINYNFYCIEELPDLIDENYCKSYQVCVSDLMLLFLAIAKLYEKAYQNGEIKAKARDTVFNKPVVFVEGEHDITYIKKAAELLNKLEILNQIELRQRGGAGNLDKIWEVYKESNWETIRQKKLLLYDCDMNKKNEQTGDVFRTTIKTIEENRISKGIENLFPDQIVEQAINSNKAFVYITKVHQTKRGEVIETITYSVNKDEKKNFCSWICENASVGDFIHFETIFAIITETILSGL